MSEYKKVSEEKLLGHSYYSKYSFDSEKWHFDRALVINGSKTGRKVN